MDAAHDIMSVFDETGYHCQCIVGYEGKNCESEFICFVHLLEVDTPKPFCFEYFIVIRKAFMYGLVLMKSPEPSPPGK